MSGIIGRYLQGHRASRPALPDNPNTMHQPPRLHPSTGMPRRHALGLISASTLLGWPASGALAQFRVEVTGVGLTVDTVRRLLSGYQQRYQRSVYFVDTTGRITLTGAQGGSMRAALQQQGHFGKVRRGLKAKSPRIHYA